jgi:hypothetical protein
MNALTHPEPLWRRIGLALLATGLSLALYSATAAPWLTWAHEGADGGDLIAAAMTGGVAHPSGYPTYCLLGRLFALLPLGNIARRLTLFSATAAAGSVALVFLLARNLLSEAEESSRGKDLLALGAALVWGAGPALWSQAIIVEVYALHALFAALVLYLASRRAALERPRAWLGLGLAVGLGLGNHLTLTLLLPGLALWLWPLARPRRMAALLGGLALGLAVYLYIPLAARGDPPVSWGDARDWVGFWWLVSGRLYHGYLFALPLAELPGRLAFWAQRSMAQLTLPGAALALLGLEARWRRAPRGWPAGGLLAAALVSLYAIGYHTSDSYLYLLPAFLVGVTWLAQGALWLGGRLAAQKPWLRWAGWLAPALLALWLAAANYGRLDLSRDNEAAVWAEAVLQAAPEGALLISHADGHTFSLDYIQWVEGRRTDLLVVDGDLLAHEWYRRQLVRRRPALGELDLGNVDALIAAHAQGRVYLTLYREGYQARWRLEREGVLWRVAGPR